MKYIIKILIVAFIDVVSLNIAYSMQIEIETTNQVKCPSINSIGIQYDDNTLYVNDLDDTGNYIAYSSQDYGANWNINSIKYASEQLSKNSRIAYLYKGNGIILSSNGNYSFRDFGNKLIKWNGDIQSIYMRGKYGYLVNTVNDKNKKTKNILYTTETNGIHWNKNDNNRIWFDGILSFDRIDNETVIAIAYKHSKTSTLYYLVKYDTHKKSWVNITDLKNIIDVIPTHLYFINNNTGFISSGRDEGLFKTNNGGKSWVELNPPERTVTGMYFKDEKAGRVVGGITGAIYETQDSGKTWKKLSKEEIISNEFDRFYANTSIDRWNEFAVMKSIIRCYSKSDD